MYYILFSINALLMIVPPILLGRYIARRWKIGWTVFAAGAGTFILSQVGHLPFNAFLLPELNNQISGWSETTRLIILSIFLGLSAGVFEEVARFFTYRYWQKDVRSWAGGLMLGAGHGGVEAVILGLIFGVNFFVLSAYDGGFLPNLLGNVPADQLPDAQEALRFQIEALFSLPWYGTILGGIERIFAVILHLSLSLMVLQTILRAQRRWLFFAIGWHTIANAGALIIIEMTNEYLAELFLAIIALVSLFIIRELKRPEPIEPEPEPLPRLKPITPVDVEPTAENLERSRYL